MRKLVHAAPALAICLVAFCGVVRAESLDGITNSTLKSYALNEMERGAPSLHLVSRALHREAIELDRNGNWEAARQKLLLAASLGGDDPGPLFTLARIELLHAHPDFLFHFGEGISKTGSGFFHQALLAANGVLMLTGALAAALAITLLTLLVRYWSLYEHWIIERYAQRYAFPPERCIGAIVIVCLLLLRPGAAVYMAILTVALWSMMNRKERGLVTVLILLLSAISFFSGRTNTFMTAMDPNSATRRLERINSEGADSELIGSISDISNPSLRAERDYALGTLMYRLGNHEEARRLLLDSVSRRKDFSKAFLNLGNVYFEQGDFDRALAGYQSAISIDSTNALAYYNLGQAYIKKMLFAESSSALKTANTLGLEDFRSRYPIAGLRNLTVYEAGFDAKDLWSIARVESRGTGGTVIGEMLDPFMIFPFGWLWALLIAAWITAMITSARPPESWRVFRCDNCGRPACRLCADDETGLHMCKDCSGVIHGLTSIKVMEALLRHKRQKHAMGRERGRVWRRLLLPLGAFTYFGKTGTGVALAVIESLAVMVIAWRGLYFKDPRALVFERTYWIYVLPALVLLMSLFGSAAAKHPVEQKNYRILPPDFRVNEQKRGEKKQAGPAAAPKEPIASFLDAL